MKLHILSDLHLDVHPYTLVPHPEADVIVLAGDVAPIATHSRQFENLVAQCAGKKTIFVFGNHEYYGSSFPVVEEFVFGLHYKYPNFHPIDDSSVEFDGVQFIGATLWSDFKLYGENRVAESMELAERNINDFRMIYTDEGTLFTAALAAKKNKWSNAAISSLATQGSKKSVIVTHFLPRQESINERWAKSALNPYFTSNAPFMCEKVLANVPLVCHGHTHSSCDYMWNGTRVVCNPRGYAQYGIRENNGFDSQLLVEI